MFSQWPIRKKLQLGVATLFLIVAILAFSGVQGVYAFRELTRSVRARASELPLASQLTQSVSELRLTLSQARQESKSPHNAIIQHLDKPMLGGRFRTDFLAVRENLSRYEALLRSHQLSNARIADTKQEREIVAEVDRVLANVEELNRDEDWHFDSIALLLLDDELMRLQELTSQLPGFMTLRMDEFADHARTQYRTWIVLSWLSIILAAGLIVTLLRFFHSSIFLPLRLLVQGSRRVAGGDFAHRIQVHTNDEVAELAGAMNAMTVRFQEIRDDLDAQVRQRTKEVVRSEQLASVGFLAAGVAHEINNPLASIAWAAESLESRLHDIIQADDEKPDEEHNEEIDVLRKYLRRIQDEAFRCKGITEKLLDFSRLGDQQRHLTDLAEVVRDVIEMLQHLGKYRGKDVRFEVADSVYASVNPQEVKQVVLNLISNSLDSLDDGGFVEVELRRRAGQAELVVRDNGCGMTEEVKRHLFEPFFTRRRNGQGTGLGLSITYRIIEDHGGTIQADSEGPGRGAQFRVTFPLIAAGEHSHEEQRLPQAA